MVSMNTCPKNVDLDCIMNVLFIERNNFLKIMASSCITPSLERKMLYDRVGTIVVKKNSEAKRIHLIR